jgi:hypothetical protein
VCVAFLAQGAPLGGAAKRNNQFTIRPQHDGWKRAIEKIVLINDNVLDFTEFRLGLAFRKGLACGSEDHHCQ